MNQEPSLVMHCANHPNVETLLRCNKCGKPICTKCAIHTPVGYRCQECIRGQQNVYFTATTGHKAAGSIVAIVLGLVLGVIAYFAGQLSWLALLIGPVVGGVAGEAIFRASGRKRARRFDLVGAGLVSLGALITFAPLWLIFRFLHLWTLLWGVLFIVLAVGAVYARLR